MMMTRKNNGERHKRLVEGIIMVKWEMRRSPRGTLMCVTGDWLIPYIFRVVDYTDSRDPPVSVLFGAEFCSVASAEPDSRIDERKDIRCGVRELFHVGSYVTFRDGTLRLDVPINYHKLASTVTTDSHHQAPIEVTVETLSHCSSLRDRDGDDGDSSRDILTPHMIRGDALLASRHWPQHTDTYSTTFSNAPSCTGSRYVRSEKRSRVLCLTRGRGDSYGIWFSTDRSGRDVRQGVYRDVGYGELRRYLEEIPGREFLDRTCFCLVEDAQDSRSRIIAVASRLDCAAVFTCDAHSGVFSPLQSSIHVHVHETYLHASALDSQLQEAKHAEFVANFERVDRRRQDQLVRALRVIRE
ncbi:hypothetical protein Tco_0161482 [Tanacetum coccineum]